MFCFSYRMYPMWLASSVSPFIVGDSYLIQSGPSKDHFHYYTFWTGLRKIPDWHPSSLLPFLRPPHLLDNFPPSLFLLDRQKLHLFASHLRQLQPRPTRKAYGPDTSAALFPAANQLTPCVSNNTSPCLENMGKSITGIWTK